MKIREKMICDFPDIRQSGSLPALKILIREACIINKNLRKLFFNKYIAFVQYKQEKVESSDISIINYQNEFF